MNNSITNYCYVSHAVQWQQSIFMFYRYVTVVSYLKAKIILNKTFKLLLQQSTNHQLLQTCGEVVQTGLAQLSAASQLTTPHAVFTSIFLVRSRDGVSANDISELITWRRLSQWHLRADHVTASQPMTSQSYHQSYDNILLFISDNITHRCLYKIKN